MRISFLIQTNKKRRPPRGERLPSFGGLAGGAFLVFHPLALGPAHVRQSAVAIGRSRRNSRSTASTKSVTRVAACAPLIAPRS